MIPNFPTLKKLQLEDKTEFENYTKQFLPYSDYNFVSLYSYNTQNKIEISFLFGNLVVVFEDYLTGEPFFSFIGRTNIEKTIDTLLQTAEQKGITTSLKLVPETVIETKEDLSGFTITEDPDNHDYILSVEDLAGYKGKKFYDKRNLTNRFKRLYPQYSTETLELTTEQEKKQIIELFFVWEKRRNKTREETQHELTALGRLLDASSSLNLHTLGIYINETLIAFTIQEVLQDEYAIIHFEKNDISYPGISALLRQESAKFLQQKNCKLINFEQDLGIEGLKKAKELWRPVTFLKKYTINPK